MKARFESKKPEGSNIYSFFFEPTEPFSYTAGQYIEISLPHPKPDSRGIKRWFTISASPLDEHLSITTRLFDKPSSFKQALSKLEPGTEINFNGPFGDFVLPKIVQTPLVFVAGGIGVTPFHSMLSWLSVTQEERPIKMLYAVKNEEDIIFQETFDAANQHVTYIVSEPTPAWGGEQGQLSAELITGLSNPTPESLIYVSGPEGLIESLEKDLKLKGIKKDQLVLDFFPNYDGI